MPHEVNLFGAGRFARDAAQALVTHGIAVRAFLTSGQPSQASLDGLPWRQLQAADLEDAELWVAVFNHQRASDYAALQAWLQQLHAGARPVWPQAWIGHVEAAMGFRFWLRPAAAYASVHPDLDRTRQRLADEASRAAFDALLAFRSQATHFHRPPQPVAEPQYLPAWLQQHLRAQGTSGLRIADGGAYQGETLRELGDLIPIEQAWAFEPDAANFTQLQQQMTGQPVHCVQAGLSDRAASLAFDAGAGAASSISALGTHRIEVRPLDELLDGEPINFLKLDVEGHELRALEGARATLRRCRPVLAIAGYHRWDDLWRLGDFIEGLDLGYRQRLMVHQHNSFDTVLYAT